MIDPLLPSETAQRLNALRSTQTQRGKRRKPAHTSKILTAGVSTTAMLALVAGMGWQTRVTNAQSVPTTLPGLANNTTPASTASPVPDTSTTVAIAPIAVPPTVAPLTVIPPPTVAPATIPVAVPAPQAPAKKKAAKKASNATTKSSG